MEAWPGAQSLSEFNRSSSTTVKSQLNPAKTLPRYESLRTEIKNFMNNADPQLDSGG